MPAIATAGRPRSVGGDRGLVGRGRYTNASEVVGRVVHHVAEAPAAARGRGRAGRREAGHHLRADRVQLELERRHDAEVAAAAAQRPEQLGVLVGAGAHGSPSAVTSSTASRLSHVRPCLRSSQPEPPPSVSPATPVLDTRPPRREAVLLGGGVDLAPGERRRRRGRPGGRVDLELAQAADVDDEAVVDEREAGDRVAAGAHRHRAARARARTRARRLTW